MGRTIACGVVGGLIVASGVLAQGTDTPGPAPGPAHDATAPAPPKPKPDEPSAGAVISPEGCRGWGLTTPLFGISNRDFESSTETKRNSLLVTGPIQAGLGGGYFRSIKGGGPKCEDFAFGWEVFGLSEGLNPADTFQIGVGGGLALNVSGKFNFGLGLGVDLVRRQKYTRGAEDVFINNGLLILNDGHNTRREWLNNLTLLITFSISDNKSKSGGAGSGSASGSGS